MIAIRRMKNLRFGVRPWKPSTIPDYTQPGQTREPQAAARLTGRAPRLERHQRLAPDQRPFHVNRSRLAESALARPAAGHAADGALRRATVPRAGADRRPARRRR